MDLPPELLRKGRFDEIFFVDLPDQGEREDIARIHVERRNRDVKVLDPKAIATICDTFSGAEIEQAIIDAMFKAYSEDREVTLKDIETAASDTMPLSKTMAEDINKLRQWAKGRARYANKKLAEKAEGLRTKMTRDDGWEVK
jgi:SpoVK/Ycf46/Vps4 family AAA+-type ATPase